MQVGRGSTGLGARPSQHQLYDEDPFEVRHYLNPVVRIYQVHSAGLLGLAIHWMKALLGYPLTHPIRPKWETPVMRPFGLRGIRIRTIIGLCLRGTLRRASRRLTDFKQKTNRPFKFGRILQT